MVTTGQYFDVAVRDLAMAVGAFTLAKLSEARAGAAVHADRGAEGVKRLAAA